MIIGAGIIIGIYTYMRVREARTRISAVWARVHTRVILYTRRRVVDCKTGIIPLVAVFPDCTGSGLFLFPKLDQKRYSDKYFLSIYLFNFFFFLRKKKQLERMPDEGYSLRLIVCPGQGDQKTFLGT